MGQVFSQLTKTGIQDQGGNTQWVPQDQAAKTLVDANRGAVQPSTAQYDNSGNTTGFTQPTPTFAKAVTPSYQQAASLGATPGGGNATSPALTKAGKLGVLLTSGLQGALAGRAKSEETVAATGGRRAGGAGMGFEAGFTLPWQRQAQQNQLAQQEAQIEATKAQSQMIQTPYGLMPASIARFILPAQIRGEATEGAAGTRAGASRDVAATNAKARTDAAQIGQKFKAVPGVGLFDTQSRQVIPGTQQGVTITPEMAKDFDLPDEFVGKPMKISDLNGIHRNENQQLTTVQGAGGPAVVNKKTKETTSLGLGAPSLGSPREFADVNNPGQTIIGTGAQAIGQPGVQSASVQVPKTALKAEVPTKIGDLKVAFTTMDQHADLLRKAVKAVGNNDNQTLNSLKNSFKNEFGYSGPITAAAIADAYKGEVSNVINKGHITDTGNEKIAHTLDPSKQSPAQMEAVLAAYQGLAQSKMKMLQQQQNAAVAKSQPKSKTPAAAPPTGATHIVPGPDGKNHYTNAQGTVDLGVAP
jgi:hypothetical protein